jgi:hypothetical protein
MYKVIENPKRMTFGEIEKQFNGKWVYIVDVEGKVFSPSETGRVAVVADDVYEGYKTGIYDEIDKKYPDGVATDLTLFSDGYFIPTMIEVLPDEL